jgi:hypothetical protein
MGRHFFQDPSDDLKIQTDIKSLLVSTNYHALENIEKDELWSVDVNTGEWGAAINL